MNARTIGKVFEDLQSGNALRTLKTLAALSDARIVFTKVAKRESATTIISEVASYFKRNGFLVVKDGVGYKIGGLK